VAEELAVKGLTTLETNEAPVQSVYYEGDAGAEDDDDVTPVKRANLVKKSKRPSLVVPVKRKVDTDAASRWPFERHTYVPIMCTPDKSFWIHKKY
jgi:hypothetical protein